MLIMCCLNVKLYSHFRYDTSCAEQFLSGHLYERTERFTVNEGGFPTVLLEG